MIKRIITIIFFLSIFFACTPDLEVEMSDHIVVEGWIEEGGFPIVILTTTIPVDDEYHEWESVQDHIIRWAKVSVNDGDKEYVLTGKMNKDYFPPYIYTTSRLRGEVGKTYSLKVEYSGKVVTARTTIPEPARLEWVKVKPSTNGKVSIVTALRDNPLTEDYYKFFIKTEGKDSTYISSFMGLFSDDALSEDENIIYIRGMQSEKFGMEESGVYHDPDDVVYIKLCTLEYEPFCYWEDYEDVSLLSRNPFFPVSRPMRSNVSSGYGYWAGYGPSYYKVSIPDSLSYKQNGISAGKP